jgi:hypothetical protein
MVCTVEAGGGIHVGACWDGGHNIGVFVHVNGQPRRVVAWSCHRRLLAALPRAFIPSG